MLPRDGDDLRRRRGVGPDPCDAGPWREAAEVLGALEGLADRPEINRVLPQAEDTPWSDVLVFLARTGCRRGEALAIRWGDVDGNQATIRATLTDREGIQKPKNGRSRSAALSGDVVEMLKERRAYLVKHKLWPSPDDFVFADPLARSRTRTA